MTHQPEKWLPIVGYAGHYEVSDLGNVCSLKRTAFSRTIIVKGSPKDVFRTIPAKPLVKSMSNHGYKVVSLCKEGVVIRKSVHRLVCEAFLLNPNNYPFVNHIDSDRTNNWLVNLEWCTGSQNMQHAYNAGRLTTPPAFLDFRYGKDHHGARRTYAYRKDKTLVGIYDTIRQAAQALGLEEKNIRAVAVGKRHTCGGLIFSYSELADAWPGVYAYKLDERGNPVPLDTTT